MLDVVSVIVQMALGIVLPVWLLRLDERHLSETMLARAWPKASFWSAVVAFGPLCLPVHFVRTRRSLVGLLLGLLAISLTIGLQILVNFGFSALNAVLTALGGE